MPVGDPIKVPCKTTLGRDAETLVRAEEGYAVMVTPFPGGIYTADELAVLIAVLVSARREVLADPS